VDDRLTTEEIARLPKDPWLPAETLLVVGSLVLGVALLGVLLWASAEFFPVQGR
jgi:hypothetical protein